MTMGGQIPFDKDSAEVNEEAALRLRQLSERLKGHTNIFVIKGHTSRDEEQSPASAENDLGYRRARAAAAKLAALGLGKESLRVESCRDFEPLKEAAYSEQELALNRRVEIVATESLVSEVRGSKGDTGEKKPRAATSQVASKGAASQPIAKAPSSQTTARIDLPGEH